MSVGFTCGDDTGMGGDGARIYGELQFASRHCEAVGFSSGTGIAAPYTK
jgi:hypothetical protein